MEPFKNIFSHEVTNKYVALISENYKLNKKAFIASIESTREELELKDRVKLIASALKEHIKLDYPEQLRILLECLANEDEHEHREWEGSTTKGLSGFQAWPIAQFVESYGLEHFDESMQALKEITKRFTSEFAIRPYLDKYPSKVFKELTKWKKDHNHHVRRLVSEGTRPNLPWGLKVKNINENLERNTKLIHSLSIDDSEYVRRSVANHLNDIARLDQDLFFEAIGKIKDPWIIKRASRNLLKQGVTKAFIINGFSAKPKLKDIEFKTGPKMIKEGDRIKLNIKLQSTAKSNQKINLSLAIHFPLKNGELSKKVFHLKDVTLKASDQFELDKDYHFKKVTTRKHYKGHYPLELLVNGVAVRESSFKLN